ncbi:MAG: 8-oxo-dGTP diphosphatase [Bacteriovoracaceae bacterium]|jgi:8-oxo-dGTP diphosphatase|nr:8-oxo-dGTP diphosphatase [Bacteriovoracaceae bacterium]
MAVTITKDSKILFTLVYLVHKEQTLMIHRVKKENDIHKDKYNGLGGKLEKGETPLQCAMREVKEESNLDIEDIKFKGHLLFPNFDGIGNDWQVFLYRADSFSGELITENREGNLVWIDNDKMADLPLWEGDKIFLKYLYGPEIIDASFTYKNGQLSHHKIAILNN